MEAYSLLMLLGSIIGVIAWAVVDSKRHRREEDYESSRAPEPASEAARPLDDARRALR